MRSADLRRAALRIRVSGCLLTLALVALGARATHLAVLDQRAARRAASQTESTWVLPAPRGMILDRRGAELAVSVGAPSVYAVPPLVEDAELAARKLTRILGRSPKALRARLEREGEFAYLARWIDDDTAAAVEALELPGVEILREPRRAYPHRQLAAHVIGFANIDAAGVRGVEQLEDTWLRGREREVPVQRDARRRALANGALDARSAAGGDVSLTLDAALQAAAEEALAEGVAAAGARGGVVVSLDPRTGDLLAVAESPPFDPNEFRTVPYPSTRSRAFLDAVEPGSTMKPFVVAAALEKGVLSPSARIDCEESGHWRVPGKTLRDFRGYGVLDLGGIIRGSSNIGAAKVGYAVGAEFQYAHLRRLGFGRPTGSGFPDESAGLLRHWRHWQPVDHATVSFGQGMNVTAVQMAAAMGALAGGGLWRTPRLLDARRAPGGRWEPIAPQPPRRAVRPEVATQVLAMMEEVVGPGGTGRRAGLSGVRVAGKTGTAQKLDPETGAYSSKRYMAWFVGAVPADDPRLVIVVMIDEPTGVHGGGAVAAPVFARAAAGQLAQFDVWTEPEMAPALAPPLLRAEAEAPETDIPAVAAAPPEIRVQRLGDRLLVPDFQGRSLEEILAATAGTRLRVEASGRGRAVAQEPAPGTVLAGGALVRVHFAPAEPPPGRQLAMQPGGEG